MGQGMLHWEESPRRSLKSINLFGFSIDSVKIHISNTRTGCRTWMGITGPRTMGPERYSRCARQSDGCSLVAARDREIEQFSSGFNRCRDFDASLRRRVVTSEDR